MELKGKCKAEFEKWYDIQCYDAMVLINEFWEFSSPMQYGVLVDYFDSVGINLMVSKNAFVIYGVMRKRGIYNKEKINSRHKAREQAIIKACAIRNDQLENE